MCSTFKNGVIDCIPTLLGYIGIGIAAGVIGQAANLSVLEVTLLAVIVYAGSAQFIIAGLMLISSPISAIVFTVFLVNLRHFLMSMAIATNFKKYSLLNNIGIGSLLTDETFAVTMSSITKRAPITAQWMHGLNLTAYLTWILSCFIGAIIGNWLPDPRQFGIDYALVAMFIGLLYLQFINDSYKTKKSMILVMLTVTVLLIILMKYMSSELALLIATLFGCLCGVLIEKCR